MDGAGEVFHRRLGASTESLGVVWIAMKPNESPALPSFGGTGRDWNPQEWKLFPSKGSLPDHHVSVGGGSTEELEMKRSDQGTDSSPPWTPQSV